MLTVPPAVSLGRQNAVWIRRRFKQTVSLKGRLETFARDAIDKPSHLLSGSAKDELLKKARPADTRGSPRPMGSFGGSPAPEIATRGLAGKDSNRIPPAGVSSSMGPSAIPFYEHRAPRDECLAVPKMDA